jgi:hypothetical protein
MEPHLQRFVDTYTKAIKQNNAAIFAGAGLSIPAGFVNWKELLKDVADELNLNIDTENDLIALAQYHVNEKGNNRHKLNQLLIDEFTRRSTVTANHKILASLPISVFWTTNYDKLIEKALENQGKTPDVKITQANLSTNVPHRDAVVYKMHGDVSMPDEAVLTKDDYEGYYEKRQLFATALQGDLISKTFLFIGFSFDDPNLEYILSRIRVLLGNNQREHYCFFKKINKADFKTDAEFRYAEVKQQLRINDLKRYSINALLVDDFNVITEVLNAIQKKVNRSNIFISGAAYEYGNHTEQQALSFIHKLSNSLAAKGYKIISGFGYGVGSAVINGTLEYIFSTNYRHLDNFLSLRPFPQVSTGSQNKEELYTQYRIEMLSAAGIALFVYGNKQSHNGLEEATGMYEEFEIALKNGVIPVPIGASGYVSKVLWAKVTKDLEKFYPKNNELRDSIKAIGDESINEDELIKQLVKIIGILQTNF